MSQHALYTQHHELIEQVIKRFCSRNRLPADEAEDFASDFRLKLLEDNTLAKFEGRSSLQTWLVVVIARAFQDFRNTHWGKWRTSAEAKRLGPLAELLERLVIRDRLSLDEAHQSLRVNHALAVQREELAALAARFPPRRSRTMVGAEELWELPASTPPADERLQSEESEPHAAAVVRAVNETLSELPLDDQLLLRFRFIDGLAVPAIAKVLQADPRPLYRRIDRLLDDLGKALNMRGLTADSVSLVLACEELESLSNWSLDKELAPKPARAEIRDYVRPSEREPQGDVEEGYR